MRMFIKRYIVASIVLIVLVAWYVYGFVTDASIGFQFVGIVLPTMPIAAWVAMAMSLLFVATIMHMLFAIVVEEIRLGKYDRDYAQLMTAFADALLKKKGRSHLFRTDRYNKLGKIVDKTDMTPDSALMKLDEPKVAEVVELLEKLKAGQSVDLKKYNLLPSNVLVQQNAVNLYREGKIDDIAVLAHADKYGESLCQEAYRHLIVEAPLYLIEKHQRFLHYDAMMILIRRINAPEHTLEIPDATLVEMIDALKDTTPIDVMRLARISAEHMLPEQRMRVFEKLSERNDIAMDGYLYTLFDLEMVDKARDLLATTGADEYHLFKAFADLKTCKKHYDINIFSSLMM